MQFSRENYSLRRNNSLWVEKKRLKKRDLMCIDLINIKSTQVSSKSSILISCAAEKFNIERIKVIIKHLQIFCSKKGREREKERNFKLF